MQKTVISMAILLTLGLLIVGCSRSQEAETIRIAYLNAETAFSVFLNAVRDLREEAADKETDIVLLQQQYQRGALAKEEFEAQNSRLQIELLQLNLNINFEALNKMIASDDFEDVRSYLRQMKVAAEPVVEQANELVMAVEVGAMDIKELETRYVQVMTAYRQFEQTLTQSALQKIYQVAREIAEEKGYDLVLQEKDVIVYLNEDKIEDITDLVKDEVSTYL